MVFAIVKLEIFIQMFFFSPILFFLCLTLLSVVRIPESEKVRDSEAKQNNIIYLEVKPQP